MFIIYLFLYFYLFIYLFIHLFIYAFFVPLFTLDSSVFVNAASIRVVIIDLKVQITTSGNVVYCETCRSLTITTSTFSCDVPNQVGGCFYVHNPSPVGSSVLFRNSKCSDSLAAVGACFYFLSSLANPPVWTMQGSTFKNNNADCRRLHFLVYYMIYLFIYYFSCFYFFNASLFIDLFIYYLIIICLFTLFIYLFIYLFISLRIYYLFTLFSQLTVVLYIQIILMA
jgi:hypothetical protein